MAPILAFCKLNFKQPVDLFDKASRYLFGNGCKTILKSGIESVVVNKNFRLGDPVYGNVCQNNCL